jgi:hypothetical protein
MHYLNKSNQNRMIFFQRVFSSSYVFYSKYKREDPFFASVIIVMAVQLLLFFLGISLVRLLTGILLMPNTSSVYLWVPLSLLWIFLVWLYFKKSDYKSFVEEFKGLSRRVRVLWALVTGMLLPVLSIAIAIVLIITPKNKF